MRPGHPKTSIHYVHVFQNAIVFEEIKARYQAAAIQLGWMSVETYEDWIPDWQNQDLAILYWGKLPPAEAIPSDRKCILGLRFTESVGDLDQLIGGQRLNLKTFLARASSIDLLLGGSPTVAEFFRPHCRSTAHAPIGYDPEVMGRPDWSIRKRVDVSFRGTPIGRREWLLPLIEKRLGKRFSRVMAFGKARKHLMDRSQTDLYIGHSEEPSFPGMRLWQAIASAAALLTEPRDAWPARPGLDYVELPLASSCDPRPFLDVLEGVLGAPDALETIARQAHDYLSQYTVERCMTDFVVPAFESLKKERVS